MIYSPGNLKDLMKLLAEKDDRTYLIAGGTDLIIKIKKRKLTDYNIIDITKIPDFKSISEDEENLYIGSTVTMTKILQAENIKKNFKALYSAAYMLGSNQIRNLATIGGNIANSSQSADCVLALHALNAKINILNSKGDESLVNIEDFITGREKNILKNDEVIKEIIIPKTESVNLFKKIGSRTGVTISKISCAMNFVFDSGKIKDTRIFLGAVGIKPVRAKNIEEVMKVSDFKDIDSEKLQMAGYDEIENAIPDRKSKYYKRVAVQGLLEDMLEELIK